MSPIEFRKLALSLPEAAERAHLNHPDFRVAGKMFATLGYPDKTHAMVRITPVEQEMLIDKGPGVFSPVKGKWELMGCTSVNLKAAKNLPCAVSLPPPGDWRQQHISRTSVKRINRGGARRQYALSRENSSTLTTAAEFRLARFPACRVGSCAPSIFGPIERTSWSINANSNA
jgi:hypothetical protein